MAWVATDNFESYSNGDLNGGNGGSGWSGAWSGSTVFDVTDANTPANGSKHISSVLESDSEVTIDRSLTTAVTSGTMYISIRINRTAGQRRANVYIYRGTTLLARIFFYDGNVGTTTIDALYWNGSTNAWQNLASGITNNTYTRIGIEVDNGTQGNKYRVSVNNGTPSSWLTFVSNASMSTGIDKVTLSDLGNNGSGTGTIYFDEISGSYSFATNVTVTPSAQVATFSVPAYSVVRGSTISANAQVATFSIPAYTVSLPKTVLASALTATFSIPAYTVDAGGNITVAAPVVTATFSVPAYSILKSWVQAVNAQTATFSTPAPTISLGSGVSVLASVLTGTFSIPAYTTVIVSNITIAPSAQVLTFSLPTIAKVGAIWRKIARSTDSTWSRTSRNST